MRFLFSIAIALVAAGCERSATVAPSPSNTSAQQCTYDVVAPDTSSTATEFRSWLKPQAGDLFGDPDDVDNGDVFVADLDNDGSDDILFARHEGSGSYLNAMVFRRVAGKWSLVEHPPFEEQLTGTHEYAGPLMNAPQLVVRLCGKTIVSFAGGTEPNYYPISVMWEGSAARPVCSEPWLSHHHAAAAGLEKRGMLDEALVLLNGIRSGCEKESPAAIGAINDSISRLAARTAAASSAAYDFSWLIDTVKTRPDQQLVLDPRFTAMLITIVPDAQLDGESLRGALKKSVWLPDDPTIIEDRYIVIAGCEPHNCGNRGFVWIDTVAKHGIAMTGGVLASRTINPENIPPVFWRHTKELLGQSTANRKLDFIDGRGTRRTVAAP